MISMPTHGVRDKQSREAELDSRAPGELSIPELARNCAAETSQFVTHGTSDGRSCLELFRRAVVRRDQDAWGCLYQQYAPLVLAWVCQRQSAAPQLVDESATSLVNAAFAKFALAVTPDKMGQFARIEAVLAYLKLCVRSVVTDALRAQQARPLTEDLSVEAHDHAGADPAEGVVDRLSAQDLWQAILEELNGEQERVVVSLVCLHGLKPREITTMHQRLFKNVEDVYRIKRNALERLRRNSRLQGFAQGEEQFR
jgi:DNA-directed RNA polymerase specialized sigma24 family protein